MFDMALAVRFNLEDEDEIDNRVWTLGQYIMSVGKGLKLKYPNSAKEKPVPRLEQIQDKLRQKGMLPTEIPTQAELFKKWNIKK
jgi:hypothetical protein